MPYFLIIIGCIGLLISSIGINIAYIQRLDSSLLIWMSSHRSSFFDGITVSLSYIGGLPAVILISGIVCIQQAWLKKYTNILFISLGVFGSAAIGWLLKYLVNRQRPDVIYQMVHTYGASFPSAHSIYAAVLACLTIFIFYKHPKFKIICSLACLWGISMGVSRVYLGAHFPTDVLAGWSIALIWISILWLLLSKSILSTNKLFSDKNLNEVK